MDNLGSLVPTSLETALERVESGVFQGDPSKKQKLRSLQSVANFEKTLDEQKAKLVREIQKKKEAQRTKSEANLLELAKTKYTLDTQEDWAAKGLVENYVTEFGKRTGLGKHPRIEDINAYEHVLKELTHGMLRGFVIGFGLKGSVNMLFAILARKGFRHVFDAVFNKDVGSFTAFLTSFVGTFRGINALLFHLKGANDRSNAAIAAGIASFSMLMDIQRRRKDIGLYLFFRSLHVLFAQLVREEKLPYIANFEQIMFGVINAPIMYGLIFEPEILDAGYYRWILSMGSLSARDLDVTVRANRRHFHETGEWLPLVPCNVAYHQGGCTEYAVKDWFYGLGRAGKVYFPVHFIPLILFRYKELMTEPGTTLFRTLRSFVASCMFLTSYQIIMKLNMCTWRNTLQRDYPLSGIVGGLLTALSCGFENKSRISELMLYCCPKSAEAVWNFFRIRGLVRNIPFGETAFFVFSAVYLLSAQRQDFKSSNFRALRFVVGA